MLNKVILMGRLTRDPELRHTQSDVPVASFSLAVDRGYSRRDDSQQSVDFINIVAWRNTAEFVSKWFTKGQLVAVSGRLQVRTYKDRDGNNRTACEVVADECFFAESKRGGESGAAAFSPFGEAPASPAPGGLNSVSSGSDFEELVGDDGELPF